MTCNVLVIMNNLSFLQWVMMFCAKMLTWHPIEWKCVTLVERLAFSGCSSLTLFVCDWERPPFIPRHFVKSTSSLPSDRSVIVKCHLVLSETEEIVLLCVSVYAGFVCLRARVFPTFSPFIFPTCRCVCVHARVCVCVWQQKVPVCMLAVTWHCHSVDWSQNAAWIGWGVKSSPLRLL